jgi:hypothetical protein
MPSDPFVKCTAQETEHILSRLQTHVLDLVIEMDRAFVIKKPLKFYADATYYEIAEAHQNPARILSFIVTGDDLLFCDGDVEKLIDFNFKSKLILNKNTILDYVRFYMGHVTGPHGQSIIVDTVEDIGLQEEPSPGVRKSLNDRIVPLALHGSLPGAGYQCRGTLLIQKTLYSVYLDVDRLGRIMPRMNTVLADVLPVQDRVLEG